MLVMTDPFFTSLQLTVIGMNARQKGWGYYEKLRANDIMIVQSNQQVSDMINRGERVIAAGALDSYAAEDRKDGHPIETIYPTDGTYLTGTIAALDDLAPKDRRRDMPRFQGENLSHNLTMLETPRETAATEGCTPAQLALAWLLSRRPFVVPLPGSKQRRWLDENRAAVALSPSEASLAALDAAFAPDRAAGTRYPAAQMKRVGI